MTKRNFKRTQIDDEVEEERVEKYESRQRRKKTSVKEFYREEYEEKIMNDTQKKTYVSKKKKEIPKRRDQCEGNKVNAKRKVPF
jgi:hypothetical protein